VRFYFNANQVHLVVKDPTRLLRTASNLFLFNCEAGRIDHGHLKDSNYDDRQQEIEIWPPNTEVLIYPNYDIIKLLTTKLSFFGHGEREGSVHG